MRPLRPPRASSAGNRAADGWYIHPLADGLWVLDTMLVWTLADNPYRRFYERRGGKLIAEKDIEIGVQKLVEVAFGWEDVASLTSL